MNYFHVSISAYHVNLISQYVNILRLYKGHRILHLKETRISVKMLRVYMNKLDMVTR